MTADIPAWLADRIDPAGPASAGLAIVALGSAANDGRDGFRLRSAAFADGAALDPCFTAQEEDAVAPPLEWTAPPSGAVELVLVAEDMDSPSGDPFCHWLVWGLAAQKGQLLEGETPPRVGKNSFGNSEWALPDPAEGDAPRRYLFQLFALDTPVSLMPGAKRADVLKAMEGHVVGTALLTASYAYEDLDDDLDWEEGDGE